MTDKFITYFGYGSLVNRETRPRDEMASAARLYGWQRVWGHRVRPTADQTEACCSLTVRPLTDGSEQNGHIPGLIQGHSSGQEGFAVDGVVVTIPEHDLPALYAREQGYDRVPVSRRSFDLPADCDMYRNHPIPDVQIVNTPFCKAILIVYWLDIVPYSNKPDCNSLWTVP